MAALQSFKVPWPERVRVPHQGGCFSGQGWCDSLKRDSSSSFSLLHVVMQYSSVVGAPHHLLWDLLPYVSVLGALHLKHQHLRLNLDKRTKQLCDVCPKKHSPSLAFGMSVCVIEFSWSTCGGQTPACPCTSPSPLLHAWTFMLYWCNGVPRCSYPNIWFLSWFQVKEFCYCRSNPSTNRWFCFLHGKLRETQKSIIAGKQTVKYLYCKKNLFWLKCHLRCPRCIITVTTITFPIVGTILALKVFPALYSSTYQGCKQGSTKASIICMFPQCIHRSI